MCNKKERKRDRRWYLFPVSTLGAVYFAVHGGTRRGGGGVRGGTGRLFFFPRRDEAVVFFSEAGRGGVFFFRGGTGWLFFFFSTGRDGAVFCFFFEGRDGTVVFGGDIFLGGTGQNRYTVPPAVHVKPWKFVLDERFVHFGPHIIYIFLLIL